MSRTCRIQEQARSLDSISANNDHLGFQRVFMSIRVKVSNPSRASVLAEIDPRYHAMVSNLGAMLECIRNVRYQRALFGSDFATLNTESPIDAMRPIAMRPREDRYWTADADPDAQFRAAFDQNVSASAHRMRPIRISMRITPRKIGRTGDWNFLFEQLVIRLYVFIRDWPVNPDAIFRVNSEVGRMQARSESRPMNRAAANPSPAVVCA